MYSGCVGEIGFEFMERHALGGSGGASGCVGEKRSTTGETMLGSTTSPSRRLVRSAGPLAARGAARLKSLRMAVANGFEAGVSASGRGPGCIVVTTWRPRMSVGAVTVAVEPGAALGLRDCCCCKSGEECGTNLMRRDGDVFFMPESTIVPWSGEKFGLEEMMIRVVSRK